MSNASINKTQNIIVTNYQTLAIGQHVDNGKCHSINNNDM